MTPFLLRIFNLLILIGVICMFSLGRESFLICLDDKHQIKCGEAGFPVAAAERGQTVFTSTQIITFS